MKKKAFTLIELLVVITIIALLVSILMPALSRAKEQAKIILCASNLKQQALAIQMYAKENNGSVPNFPSGAWLWDLAYESTRLMNKYAGIQDNQIYACPSNLEREYNDRRWWQFTEYGGDPDPSPLTDEESLTAEQRRNRIRVMPYIYMFDRPFLPDTVGNETPRKAVWISNLDRVRMGGEVPMIVDSIIERHDDLGRFFDMENGGMEYLEDSSNHKSRSRNDKGLLPSGANHAYVDGHVSWVMFNETERQARLENPSYPSNWFWWKF